MDSEKRVRHLREPTRGGCGGWSAHTFPDRLTRSARSNCTNFLKGHLTMTNENFLRADNPEAMDRCCKVAAAASTALIREMTVNLPLSKKAALANLLKAGGGVGVLITFDERASIHYSLVAIPAAGGQHTLATVTNISEDGEISHGDAGAN